MSKSRINSNWTSSQPPSSSLAIDRDSSRSPNPPTTMLHHHSSTNPALTLPMVNLGFDELREQMNRFTIRFDEFIEKGRKKLLEDKNEFSRNIAEDKESAREKKAQIEYYKEQEAEVLEQSRREDEEYQEAQNTINNMRRTYNDLSTTQAHLTSHISTLSSTITSKRNHLAKQRSNLTQLSTTNTPELSFWEDNLGMRIEGAGVTDHLKIVFTHIDERDWDREFMFVISLEKRDYSVVLCKPKLPQEYIDRTVQRLNESRGFGAFLKEMRVGFVELVKSGVVDVGK